MAVADRYAIISDIHCNLSALTAVLQACDDLGAEKIICLGDIVGYGAAAKECLALVQERCAVVVQGNHDAQVTPPRHPQTRPEALIALEYNQKILDDAQRRYLAELPHPVRVDNYFLAAHGSPRARDEYLLGTKELQANLQVMAKEHFGLQAAFFGHTHLPMVLSERGARTQFSENPVVNLAADLIYLINPGSVGQPRDKNPQAAFCLFDTEARQVIFQRVAYDIKAEQKRMREAKLPPKLIERLALGR